MSLAHASDEELLLFQNTWTLHCNGYNWHWSSAQNLIKIFCSKCNYNKNHKGISKDLAFEKVVHESVWTLLCHLYSTCEQNTNKIGILYISDYNHKKKDGFRCESGFSLDMFVNTHACYITLTLSLCANLRKDNSL